MYIIKTKISRVLLFIVSILLVATLIIAFLPKHEQMSDDITANIGMTFQNTYGDNIDPQYLLNITEFAGYNFSIDNIKTLKDNDNNIYDLIETLPCGYYIFDRNTKIMLEASSSSISPYYGIYNNLYYFGMKEYYVKSNARSASFIHTINKYTIDSNEITYLEYKTKNMQAKLIEHDDISHYADGGASVRSRYAISRMKECGYAEDNGNGICGYIALSIAIVYQYIDNSTSWIQNSNYVTDAGGYIHGTEALTLKLRQFGIDRGFSNGSYSSQIRDIGNDYKALVGKTKTADHMSLWTPFFTWGTVRNKIENNIPVILFGSMPSAQTSEKINHAVLCYAYDAYSGTGINYIVHFGWPGYSAVAIHPSNVTLGSIYAIWPK